jgi:hypothetical protein
MISIAIIALIAAIGFMSIGNINRNAFARSSHHDHGNNEGDDQKHGCIYQKHGSGDQKHVCIYQKHGSGDQEEIISSSPGLPQQQLYLNHIHAGNP